ncbi:FAD-binding protein [Rhodanobacter glycinis]|uniref:NAD(P)-binding domain-containing protein n=1 Tax=Rhodanobacter glycinis TaxID=582702 RepID=UPI001128AB06|nr:NAD(P)-binding domain-containing protein [Rhodanobacter glycinis]TPG45538.1 FAD-binding protein [Rhodanobacter glycinis]
MIDADAIIVGAGPAGLACAASMRLRGLDVTMLEKAGAVASVWRRHYDRLHLHTDRGHSGLPGLPMPRSYPVSVACPGRGLPGKLRGALRPSTDLRQRGTNRPP